MICTVIKRRSTLAIERTLRKVTKCIDTRHPFIQELDLNNCLVQKRFPLRIIELIMIVEFFCPWKKTEVVELE